MTCQVFVGEDISSNYQKYRFRAPDEVRDTILQFLGYKKAKPHVLAVDLGCGTGQTTRLLAPHFQVVGIDVSETQLEQARAVLSCPNITYRKGTAEDLPFPDGSVDLITASSAAHYFDESKFMAEANRVLKPGGCIALMDYSSRKTRLHYQDCGERLTDILQEMLEVLMVDTSIPVVKGENMLEDVFSAISFPDKQRAEGILKKSTTSVRKVLGAVKATSMFQIYKGKDAQRAEELFLDTQKRLLEEMKATSPDTEIEWTLEYFCIMASKPQQ
eukprot:XP_003962152.1 PREDICTED: uncharacterized protein LOC101073886 [Takifugu rubripes]